MTGQSIRSPCTIRVAYLIEPGVGAASEETVKLSDRMSSRFCLC